VHTALALNSEKRSSERDSAERRRQVRARKSHPYTSLRQFPRRKFRRAPRNRPPWFLQRGLRQSGQRQQQGHPDIGAPDAVICQKQTGCERKRDRGNQGNAPPIHSRASTTMDSAAAAPPIKIIPSARRSLPRASPLGSADATVLEKTMRIEPVRVKPFAQNLRRQREMVVQRIRASQRRHRRKPFDEEYAAKGAGQEFVEPRQQPYLLDRLRECPRSARNSKSPSTHAKATPARTPCAGREQARPRSHTIPEESRRTQASAKAIHRRTFLFSIDAGSTRPHRSRAVRTQRFRTTSPMRGATSSPEENTSDDAKKRLKLQKIPCERHDKPNTQSGFRRAHPVFAGFAHRGRSIAFVSCLLIRDDRN